MKKRFTTKYKYLVVFSYNVGWRKVGDVYSRHVSYENARKSCRRSGFDSFLSIKRVDDYFVEE